MQFPSAYGSIARESSDESDAIAMVIMEHYEESETIPLVAAQKK